MDDPNQDEDMIDPDDRRPPSMLDRRVQASGELSDSDDEDEGGRRNHVSHRERSMSSNGSRTGRKFGMGVGIMTAPGAASTHGAGPSGHTTMPPPGLGPMDQDAEQGSGNAGSESRAESPIVQDSVQPGLDDDLPMSEDRDVALERNGNGR